MDTNELSKSNSVIKNRSANNFQETRFKYQYPKDNIMLVLYYDVDMCVRHAQKLLQRVNTCFGVDAINVNRKRIVRKIIHLNITKACLLVMTIKTNIYLQKHFVLNRVLTVRNAMFPPNVRGARINMPTSQLIVQRLVKLFNFFSIEPFKLTNLNLRATHFKEVAICTPLRSTHQTSPVSILILTLTQF